MNYLLLATETMSDSDAAALGLSFLVMCFMLYILICAIPGVIASWRKHPKAKTIWLVSMLTGWTQIGWILALVWSFNNDKS